MPKPLVSSTLSLLPYPLYRPLHLNNSTKLFQFLKLNERWDFLFFQGFTSKKDRRRFFAVLFHQSASRHCSSGFRLSLEKRIARCFLCCPHSPICFLTLFFQMTVQTALDSKVDDEMSADPNLLVNCEEVVQGHPPLKNLLTRFENEPVVANRKGEPAVVMSEYGFNSAIVPCSSERNERSCLKHVETTVGPASRLSEGSDLHVKFVKLEHLKRLFLRGYFFAGEILEEYSQFLSLQCSRLECCLQGNI
ncbi:hypothetical protein L1987_36405 [Smallanthus sonchifolius]|uniref:Uncharacterized protein n=1 Tax=Smallanthus sonchifolius TaxID=185202 RepID=A0ACB9HEC7_9ASTR|nr:hypothetical protein L1987_36405 [Smallanthus sonchifolius]